MNPASDSRLVLPVDSTPVAEAAEMYAVALPLAPVPLYGLRAGGRCACGRPDCSKSAGKHPIGDEWEKRATLDLDAVRDRFRDHRGNIGLYLGSGRFVGIDADGDVGMATLASLNLPPTLQAQSGSGIGAHLIFEYAAHQDPREVTDRNKVLPGIDVKSNGQFVAAPSRHFSGGVYRWILAVAIAVLPDSLYELIRKERRAPRPKPSVPASADTRLLEKRARKYAARFEPAIDGSDGSRAAFAAARGLHGWIAVGLPESIAWNIYLEYNTTCQPPWAEWELQHKWKDAGEAEIIPVIEDRPYAGRPGATAFASPEGGSGVRSPLPPPAPPGGSGGPPGTPATDWKAELLWAEQRNGKPKLISHVDNVVRILQLSTEWQKRIGFDVFRGRTVVSGAPWDDYQRPTTEIGTWTDEDTTRLNAWMRREFQSFAFAPTIQDCERAVPVVARTHDFNPVRDYLDGVVWDQTPRLSTWLSHYLGAEQNEYSRLVGAWWLISAVARIYEPGCKVDTVPILEGRQGIRKSSALRVLFGAEYFTDTPIDIGSKDAYTAIQGCWCVELAELDSLMRAEPTRSKAFFSSGKDRFRRAYARHEREELRQCVFVGTTNGDEYLNDPTGGRRFWPIACQSIDLQAIDRDRDQLWAEAVHEFREGRPWYPTAETEHVLLGDVQEGRTKGDSWEDKIQSFLVGIIDGQTTVAELLERALKLDPKDWTRSAETRVGAMMINRFKWAKRRVTLTDGRRVWVYGRPE